MMITVNKKTDKSRYVYLLLIICSIAIAVGILTAKNVAGTYMILLLAVLVVIAAANIARIIMARKVKALVSSVVSWFLYQSGCLLLLAFAGRFTPEDRKALWLGLLALTIIYLTSLLSFRWLTHRFGKIEKL